MNEQILNAIETLSNNVEKGLKDLNKRIDTLEKRFDRLEANTNKRFDEVNVRFDHVDNSLERIEENEPKEIIAMLRVMQNNLDFEKKYTARRLNEINNQVYEIEKRLEN
jgi:hypothetical protein